MIETAIIVTLTLATVGTAWFLANILRIRRWAQGRGWTAFTISLNGNLFALGTIGVSFALTVAVYVWFRTWLWPEMIAVLAAIYTVLVWSGAARLEYWIRKGQ
jgi:hypothetical protein